MSDTTPAAPPVPPAPAPRRPAPPLPPNHGLAVLLLTLAVLAWQVFQGVMLWQERSNLQALQAAQQPQIDAANKVRGVTINAPKQQRARARYTAPAACACWSAW